MSVLPRWRSHRRLSAARRPRAHPTHPHAPSPCSKLRAACELEAALLAGDAAAAEVGALPPLVRAHYLRGLLDWSSAALCKQQQQRSTAAPSPKLQPGCWRVLVGALRALPAG